MHLVLALVIGTCPTPKDIAAVEAQLATDQLILKAAQQRGVPSGVANAQRYVDQSREKHAKLAKAKEECDAKREAGEAHERIDGHFTDDPPQSETTPNPAGPETPTAQAEPDWREMYLNKPAMRQLALSVLICEEAGAERETRRRIAEERANSRIGGVVDLYTLKALQDQVVASRENVSVYRDELANLRKPFLGCDAAKVKGAMRCMADGKCKDNDERMVYFVKTSLSVRTE